MLVCHARSPTVWRDLKSTVRRWPNVLTKDALKKSDGMARVLATIERDRGVAPAVGGGGSDPAETPKAAPDREDLYPTRENWFCCFEINVH